MIKRILLLPVFLFLLTSCSEEEITSHWNENPIQIDGASDDWDNIPVLFNEDLDVAYGVANNDSTFSVMIRFNDQRLARMISLRGFTIWFFPPDDSGEEFGIHYQGLTRAQPRPDRADAAAYKFVPAGMFTVIREKGDPGWPIHKIPSVNASYSFFDGFYCIEYQVPLTIDKESPIQYNLKGGEEFEMEFILEEMDKSQMQAMRGGGMGGGRGGGMSGGMTGGMSGGMGGGMGRGGGMGMRGGGGMGGGMPDMSAKETAFVVKLASQPK